MDAKESNKRMKFSKTAIIIALLIYCLNLFDAITTVYLLVNNLGRELSPIVNLILSTIGYSGLIVIKSLVGGLLAVLLVLAWKEHKWVKYAAYIVLSVYSVLVVYYIINLVLLHIHGVI